ncbi:YggS family pyridoxal phosphate-dependent enzyme [Alkaliphilus serpentinus]|uniref:YggS family pyridoxal phosphate-dependent enzyme n=1 Tax=Alkaliphilus serpentinus TaxID=1482731 RepID=UPI001865833C
MNIERNLEVVNQLIQQAADNAERNIEDITLIAVTKTVTVKEVKEAISQGITDIGENRVQELLKKYEELGDAVRWHMIGHLQKNKVKYIVDKVDFIHSVDSLSLAEEIEKRAAKINRPINCLVEVNISGEDSKHGLEPTEVKSFIKKLDEFKYLRVMGLMTMAPYVEDPEATRKYFKGLRNLSEEIKKIPLNQVSMSYLSMGMSNDFQVAIEEGANMVRIGSAIFTTEA